MLCSFAAFPVGSWGWGLGIGYDGLVVVLMVVGIAGEGGERPQRRVQKGHLDDPWLRVCGLWHCLVRGWGYSRFNLRWAASWRLRSSTRARDGEGVQQGVLRLCCMVPVCELYVRWSGRSGGSVLCASDEG